MTSDSKFDGNIFAYFGLSFIWLISFLLSFLTFSLALPWVICAKHSWFVRHTVIDDRKLEFDGTGFQLFWKYLVWIIIGAAIFVGNYFLTDSLVGDVTKIDFKDINSDLILCIAVFALTFVLYMFWLIYSMKRWVVKHTHF